MEQKRQRLEELRRRKVKEEDVKPQKKDFTAQKDWLAPTTVKSELITIDKAVQIGPLEKEKKVDETLERVARVEKDDKIENGNDPTIPNPDEPQNDFIPVQPFHDWSGLNATLRDAMRDLGKLKIPTPPIDYTQPPKAFTNNTNQLQKTHSLTNGPATAWAKSSIHRLVAVAFSRKAIVYSLPQMAPEYFLESESPITKIMFDSSASSRLMGGLKSGTVVVWDLESDTSNSIAVLPLIRSPTFPIAPSIKHLHTFLHHRSPICDLVQLDGSQFASVSHEGVVNYWSSHILAAPQRNSLQLDNSVHLAIPSEVQPESGIDDWAILYENGSITYHGQTLESSNLCRKTDAFISNNRLIASGLDWTIHIWDLKLGMIIHSIVTDLLIYSLSQRPGYANQFSAIGANTRGDVMLQIWDLDQTEPVVQMLVNKYDKLPKLPTFQNSELLVLFITDRDILVSYDELSVWRLYNV